MILNINYIPVTSGKSSICLLHRVFEKENIKSSIPRAKEPSTSSNVCETRIWFHAFKKPKKQGCKEKYIYFWFLTHLMLIHIYCICPHKFSFLFIMTLIMLHLYNSSPAEGLI